MAQEQKKQKFNVGDKVKIVGNSYSGFFPNGTVCTITSWHREGEDVNLVAKDSFYTKAKNQSWTKERFEQIYNLDDIILVSEEDNLAAYLPKAVNPIVADIFARAKKTQSFVSLQFTKKNAELRDMQCKIRSFNSDEESVTVWDLQKKGFRTVHMPSVNYIAAFGTKVFVG